MSKHEDKTREELLDLVDDLEADVERLELECLDVENASISDYSDDEIRDKFHDRDLGAPADEVAAMFEAFYLGKESRAIELARQIASQHAGRIL